MTIMDDLKSLICLILAYDFEDKKGKEPTLFKRGLASLKCGELQKYRATKADSNDPCSSDFNTPVQLLREYFTTTNAIYDVRPRPALESDLIACGLWLKTDKQKQIQVVHRNGSDKSVGKIYV